MMCRISLALVAIVAPSLASAAPGDHIRFGSATLTPDLDVGFEYRTNVYRAEANPTAGLNMRIAPGLNFDLTSPDHQLTLAAEYELRPYLFLGNPTDLSKEDLQLRYKRLSRYNDFDASAGADLFRQSVVGISLSERATLRNNPNDRQIIEDERPFATQFRNYMTGELRMNATPAFEVKVGGRWAYDDFLVPSFTQTRTSFNQRNDYGPQLNVAWKFLPRTAVVANAQYRIVRWDQNQVISPDGSAVIDQPNSSQIRGTLGIRGRVTERLVVGAIAGYGSANYDEGTVAAAVSADIARDVKGLDGLLVSLHGEYSFTKTTKFRLAYRKDFIDSYFTNFVGYNFVDGRFSAGLGDNFGLSLGYGVRFEAYQGQTTRKDILSTASIDGNYAIQKWISTSAGVYWTQRASDDARVEYDDFGVRLFGTIRY